MPSVSASLEPPELDDPLPPPAQALSASATPTGTASAARRRRVCRITTPLLVFVDCSGAPGARRAGRLFRAGKGPAGRVPRLPLGTAAPLGERPPLPQIVLRDRRP